MDEHTENTININNDLYDFLRDYCDENDLRFVEFVEESLENALNFHKYSNLIAENEKVLSEIKEEYERIYNRGFTEGYYIAFCTLQGQLWAALENETMNKAAKDRPKPVSGPQLTLF